MEHLQFLLFALLFLKHACGWDVVISNTTQCQKPMQYVKLSCKTGNGGFKSCSLDYNSPVDNGDNFRVEVVVEMFRGGRWYKLIEVKEEKGLCTLLFVYLKETIEKGLDMVGEPKQCPVRKGTYHIKDLPIDLSKLQRMAIPKGKLSIHAKTFEKATGKLGVCVHVGAEII